MSRGASHLQAGQVLDDTYRIVRRIGEGGMGEVYEAAHARLAGRYAIKLLHKEVGEDPNLMARFQREAQVTSSLRHPNIVQVVDFRKTSEGAPYIVMEYLDGVELAAEIRRIGPLPLERVRDLVGQIAAGLSAAHEQGVVHRDLKPANLFLVLLPGSGTELVKIVDFGISKVRASDTQLTRTATVMGTPQYMAPEQALGQSDRIDARSDQFALATITYEMLAGRCAFVGDTIPTILYQLVHVEPSPLTVNGQPVHPAVEAVVRRGLSKQPEARFGSVLELGRAFDAAVTEARGAGAGGVGGRTALAAVASAPTALASPASVPRSIAGFPARAHMTTLGAAAGEAEAPQSVTEKLDDRGPADGGRSRAFKPAVAIGIAAVALGLMVFLVASRRRAPEAGVVGASAPPPAAAAPAAPRVVPAPPPAPPAVGPELVTITVEDAPPRLVVAIDGDSVGPPPVRLAKDSGKHELRFEAPGYRPRTMQLDSTKDLALVLSLKRGKTPGPATSSAAAPLPPAAPVASAPSGAAAAYVPPDSPPTSSPSPPPPEKRKPGRFRRGVDSVSDFAKRHFGTAGRK